MRCEFCTWVAGWLGWAIERPKSMYGCMHAWCVRYLVPTLRDRPKTAKRVRQSKHTPSRAHVCKNDEYTIHTALHHTHHTHMHTPQTDTRPLPFSPQLGAVLFRPLGQTVLVAMRTMLDGSVGKWRWQKLISRFTIWMYFRVVSSFKMCATYTDRQTDRHSPRLQDRVCGVWPPHL